MTKQSWTLILLAVVLGTFYVLRFTDFGKPRQIQISVMERPFAPRAAPNDVLPLVFSLDQDRRLTAVRITPVSEVSNSVPKRLWNLQSKAGSEPVRGFTYADEIPGMTPTTKPGALVAGVAYRVEVEAGRVRGQTEFTPHSVTE